jgi:DNA-binding MarR family transcriptional regulator
MPDLSRLFSDVIRFETDLWNGVDMRMRSDADLPMSLFEPMQIIDRVASCRVQDIARELSITIGGTSKIVDRIEAGGSCVRWPNPDDRRSSVIALTPAGKDLLQKATLTFEDELDRRLGQALPRRSLDQFITTLAVLRRAGAGDNMTRTPQ